jgi:hypothetical protein
MEREAAPAATGFRSTWEHEGRSLRRHFRAQVPLPELELSAR